MIQDQTTKVIYVGNGQTTHFPFKFKYNDKAHIHVAIYDIDTQVQTELTKDFFVDSEKNEVIYPGYQSGQEPPEAQIPPVLQANQKLVIYRQTPLTQEIDFGSKYPLPFVENGTDKNTMISQEMKEALERSVKVDMGSEVKPDELLTDIKQNVADANQSAQNAQQSANEAQEYAQKANANAQSINIRTFPNVESMKQANNLKTGGLIKTQGFYQSGDGGGADYVIVNDIGEDEVDEASIIVLQKGLYAKLLIQDYVNAKWFGVRLDGKTDDTDKFNAISDYLLRISSSLETSIYSKSVYIPSGVLIATNTIKIDLSLASWIFDGTILKAEHNGVALGLINSGKGNVYDNAVYHFEGLRVTKNHDEEDVYSTGIEVNFEGSNKQGNRISSNNVYVSNFNTGVNYKQNNTYADTWDKLSVAGCNRCLSIQYASNSGEKIAFLNSMIFNSDEAIYLNHSTADVYFYNCSIDYNKTAINMEGDTQAFFYGCHVEWSNTEKPHIINNSNTGSINFFGGMLVQTESSKYTDFAFKNEAKSCSGINIYGTLMHNIQAPALCNNGIKLSNIRTYHLGTLPNLSNNLFYDFTDKTYLPSFIYISKDNSYSISDGEIKITKFTDNAIHIIRKVNNHNRFTINLKIKSSETLPSSADILMQAYYGIKNQSDKGYSSIYFQGDIRLQSYIGTEFNSFNNILFSIPSSENITNDYDDIYAVFKIFVLSGLTDDSITLSLKDIKITAY